MKTSVSYGEVWRIAYPIILGSIAQNIINVTDTAFLGRVSEVALGAAAIGGVYYLSAVMLAWGFGVGTQIIVARRNGEEKYTEIGRTLEHAFFFLFPLAVLIFLIMKFFSGGLLELVVQSPDVFGATGLYIEYRAYGLFFVSFNFLFRAFYVGIARTKVITWTTLVMSVVNIILDYALIFGHMGMPAMGIAGAALASVIAEASATLFFFTYTFIRVPARKYRLFFFERFDLVLYLRIIRVSLPVMMQNFLSLAAWLTFFLFVEKLGERSLAISNIIRSFYMVLMIPMWGFASATNTIVSSLIGQGKPGEVLSLTFKVVRLCLLLVLIMVSFGFIFPAPALRLYTNDPVLIGEAMPVLMVVNFAALLLGVAFILLNAVSGTGKTQISFAIEVAVIVIYLAATYIIADVLRGNIAQVWMTEYIYAGLLGLLSFAYLKWGRWRSATV